MHPLRSSTLLCAIVLAGTIGWTATPLRAQFPDPSSPQARGEFLLIAGHHRQALAEFQRLLATDSTASIAVLGIARAQEGMGRTREALESYRDYSRREPRDAAGHELLGWMLAEMGRPSDALQSFRDAKLLAPHSAGATLGSAMALRRLGRKQEAYRAFREAARLSPDDATTWGYLATLSVELHSALDAAQYWDQALERDPAYFDSRPQERKKWEKLMAILGPRAFDADDAAGGFAFDEAAEPDSTRRRRVAPGRRLVSGADALSSAYVRGPTSSGSGFIVSRDGGFVLTNKHVVRACSEIRIRVDGGVAQTASVSAIDPDDDLALLRTELPPGPVAIFREPVVRPGDDVVAVGFPLSGLLADQVNVSTGTVNALAGLYNDLHLLQMSAPVQPGSSGGALFDTSGRVVGVVVTKLNARVVAEETGDIPQNVNFAIKGAVARDFLRTNGVEYVVGGNAERRSNADVGEIGRQVTALIECWR
jgi:S1-C subfamily serine protease